MLFAVGLPLIVLGFLVLARTAIHHASHRQDWRLEHAKHVWELERELGMDESDVLGFSAPTKAQFIRAARPVAAVRLTHYHQGSCSYIETMPASPRQLNVIAGQRIEGA